MNKYEPNFTFILRYISLIFLCNLFETEPALYLNIVFFQLVVAIESFIDSTFLGNLLIDSIIQ